MKFNEQLICLRKQKGLSQEQLGAELGVTRQTVSKWELGETTPEMDKLIQLSDLFQISLDSLVGHEQESETTSSYCLSQNMMMYRWHYEYKSKRTLCGIPLVHINVGRGIHKAKGIIAIGTIAKGVISIGALSTGIISLGALSAGLLSLGAISLGLLLSAGAISIGTIAFGGFSLGIFAIGGCAVGIYSIGGCAIGNKIAAGGYAHAPIAIGDKTHGEYLFDINQAIPANTIKAAILDKYPKTWGIITEIFNSFS